MKEQNLNEAIFDLNAKLDVCNSHIKKNGTQWVARGLWAMVLAMVGLIFTGVFYMGKLDKTVEILEKNMIPKSDWTINQKRTTDAYNKIFYDKDTRFVLRGKQTNAKNIKNNGHENR